MLYYFIRFKSLQPVLCIFCTRKKINHSELSLPFLFTYALTSWADLLVFSLYASASLPLTLPLRFSWPSISLHIEVIAHGRVEMHAFWEAFSDLSICKSIFHSLSFHCCICQTPLRKAIHASGYIWDDLINNLFKQEWEGKKERGTLRLCKEVISGRRWHS